MENKALLWWLGVTVLATMLMAATLILYFGRGFQPSYVLNIICDRAPNIHPRNTGEAKRCFDWPSRRCYYAGRRWGEIGFEN